MIVDARVEHRQQDYRVRLERGPEGAALLAADCAVVVVVDVLSLCTSVDIALGRGARVLPQRDDDPVADGCRADVELAAAHDTSPIAPTLRDDLLVIAAGENGYR